MLYLMENKMPYGRVVAFKVGFTNNMKTRMKGYKTHNPYIIQLETKEGDKFEEAILHEKMAACSLFYQVRKTEWFECIDRSVINIIEKKGFEGLIEICG